eukprot:XP_001703919.1 Hypothetical protein GL50803_124884 [Giardia lamblia ATCC 50803]
MEATRAWRLSVPPVHPVLGPDADPGSQAENAQQPAPDWATQNCL